MLIYKPFRLTITHIKCYETEDWTGADEMYLNVTRDGKHYTQLRKDMNDGDNNYPNFQVDFDGSIALHMYDHDPESADDHLGSASIGAGDYSSEAKFTKDDANYSVWYRVESIPRPPDEKFAKADADAITNNSLWHSSINRTKLIKDIKDRIVKPQLVDQGPTPLCGPAAIAVVFAAMKPIEYVRVIKELYETSETMISGETIKAVKHVSNAALPGENVLFVGIGYFPQEFVINAAESNNYSYLFVTHSQALRLLF